MTPALRVLCVGISFFTIVPGIGPAFAATPTAVEDVPVAGGTSALAQALHVEPVPDRGRFMYEMTRLVLDNDPQRAPELLAARLKARAQGGDRARGGQAGAPRGHVTEEAVPVPLTADWWGTHLFHRRVPREELVSAILSDRQASLVCHGLTMLDDETLQFFAEHGSLMSRIVDKLAAPAFGAFAGSLHVHDGRVVIPSGDEAAPLWEAVLLEKTTRPERFIELLFEAADGRVAYLFDTVGQLDAPRRAFALGLWIPDAPLRVDRFRQLVTVGIAAYHDWHLKTQPFGRASYDLAMTLARVEVDDRGAPVSALTRGFWSRALLGREPSSEDGQPLDAAWLTDAIGSFDVRQRAERLDQFAFGQRLVRLTSPGTEPDQAHVLFAIRNFPRYRMLLLACERIGIRHGSTYAAAVRQAARLGAFEGRRGFVAQAQFQSALALIVRTVTVGVLPPGTAERLLDRLIAVPVADDGRYGGALGTWLGDDLVAAIPPGADVENALTAALAGSSSDRRLVSWEGQQYRLDLAGSERQRLRRIREKQQAVRIDVPLEVLAIARRLVTDPARAADTIDRLTALVDDVPQRLREDETENVPPGAGVPPAPHDALKRSIEEIAKAGRAKETKRIARTAEALIDLSDEMLAASLLSLTYALDLGDPDGTALLAEDVSRRHDFGLGIRDGDVRQRAAWAMPRQEVIPGVPWHVTGSLVGLDIALAPLALRRVSTEGVLEAPRLTSTERDAFAVSVSLMNPFQLTDRDRDAIADAVARGTARVQLMTTATFDGVADLVSLDPARRRAVRWTLAHDASRALSMFTLSELLVIGGGKPSDFSAWGMTAVTPYGCVCTRLTLPAQWWPMFGRPQLGLTATVISDLNLHVAIMLRQLQLPAALARVVLAAAMQDFVDLVKPTDPGDWLTLSRTARTATRERIEDYVAAATAGGPLMPIGGGQP